jgi:hypothetical protein
MNRLCVETRGISNWRDRLAKPDSQWRRRFSAFETAVSWEKASCHVGGLPEPIAELFRGSVFGEATLLLAIAEHKVPLVGGLADSQCDVWAVLNTASGALSLAVEAKANEPFGKGNEPLEHWLVAGANAESEKNRSARWECVAKNLPTSSRGAFDKVPYQLLHRCAAAVIEARRFALPNAALVVQAFASPPESFSAFCLFCQALDLKAERGRMCVASVGEIRLGVGWADCPFATDAAIAAVT